MSKYTPPDARSVIFNFDGKEYIAPDGRAVIFNFGEEEVVARYVSVNGEAHTGYGTTAIRLDKESLIVQPFVATRYGEHVVIQQRFIKPSGFNAYGIGQANVWNFNKTIANSGFNVSVVATPRIYNLKQFILYTGFSSQVFGLAYLLGGKRYIQTATVGLSLRFGTTQVINTRANRNLYPGGIEPIPIDGPKVSPRIIYTPGILAWKFGTPQVQRNPSPKGFITDLHGTAWVSHSPRYISPSKIEAFLPGYAKIFDPTRKIYLEGAPPIAAGVFGDIRVKTNLNKITVPGDDHSLYGDWSELYSNLTSVKAHSFHTNLFGSHGIYNKTPSVIPQPFAATAFGSTMVSYRVRRILGRGFGKVEDQRFGNHRLTKSPELNVTGTDQQKFGTTWISNKTRGIPTGNLNTLAMGAHQVWFRYRHISTIGIAVPIVGTPRIEHGIRTLLALGSDSARVGQPITWFRVRKVSPSSVYREFETNHRVGGTQHIKPIGYVATKFGERVVPENQNIYSLGYDSSSFSELNRIELYKRWVRATGFISFGQQTSDRYGIAKLWNRRQYVTHEYDSGDGLNPGEFGQWTAIANRNRIIGVIGFSATRHSYNQVNNKATPIKPQGFANTLFSNLMIADRIRHIKPESMEPPYISSWGRIVNTAYVIKPIGGIHTTWGHPKIENTRREYRWVGAFDSLQVGQPMIDFAIRTLTIPGRYSIGPIYIPLPKVDLHTRYLDTIGSEHTAFGGPSLVIKWNKITPRWTYRDYFGVPEVRNLTPELRQRGVNSEIFGDTMLRLQWRPLPVQGYDSELLGRTQIAFRDRKITSQGFNSLGLGQLKVTKTGAPPYSSQTINLDWANEGARPEDFSGQGIEPPERQVSYPNVKTNVIFASGFVATDFGEHHAQSNGIIVQPGIQELVIGNHKVTLRNQTINVPTMGDLLGMADTRPRLSPHTIYAVMEAPQQAIDNHQRRSLHYVDTNGTGQPPGSVFGYPNVALKHRSFEAWGFSQWSVPRPTIVLTKHYIKPPSIASFRMGWHQMLDGSIQTIEQFDSDDFSLLGHSRIAHDDSGPQRIRMIGLESTMYGKALVDFYHRSLRPVGWVVTAMGNSRGSDTAYKPQSLWVGKPMPTIPSGFNAEKFGNTTIGLRVRDVSVQGFNTFNAETDISNFKGRLKVTLVKKPVSIEPKEIEQQSFGDTAYGTPDIRLKTHYIRPDGNSDQYRKGAPE